MGDAAAAPWGSGPMYRPPDARSEWEEPVHRPRRSLVAYRSGTVRIDAARAEEALEDVTLARARRTLALRRRLDRATTQATRAVEQRQRQDAVRARRVAAAERARLEQDRIAAAGELEAARAAVEERLRRQAEMAEAERIAAQARAREEAAARARAEAAATEQARLRAEQAERARRLALEQARLEAERVEQERLAALELVRLEEQQREQERTESMREQTRRWESRQRLALANKLERSAEFLRDYEEWARSRGLRVAAAAGLSVEADRLGRRVEELRYS